MNNEMLSYYEIVNELDKIISIDYKRNSSIMVVKPYGQLNFAVVELCVDFDTTFCFVSICYNDEESSSVYFSNKEITMLYNALKKMENTKDDRMYIINTSSGMNVSKKGNNWLLSLPGREDIQLCYEEFIVEVGKYVNVTNNR